VCVESKAAESTKTKDPCKILAISAKFPPHVDIIPECFGTVTNKVYAGLKVVSLQVYLDNIAVGSDTPEQHGKDFREILQQTRASSSRLKLKKCGVGKGSIEILGHAVRLGEVRPNDAHRDCVSRFKEPRNATELLRFLWVLLLFSPHIYRLAEMAAPLFQVLEGTKWNAKSRPRDLSSR
jgi:hypothetical protein